jgi:hypothetical protein
MVINLGSTAEVYSILGRTEESLTSDEIESKLNEADRLIRSKTHTKYSVDKFYAASVGATGASLKSYDLFFTPKVGSTPTVYVNGVLATLSTDYTITGSTLLFTSAFTLNKGDQVVVYYIPDFFDDYANYSAAERLFSTSLVDTNNAVGVATYDKIKERVEDYAKLAASKPYVARLLDHKEDHGIY